jgi:AcrR family transcriptional regulator
MRGNKSPERSVTEVRLVEAAVQLFARHGFKATTTREIAQLADLNEATLFRYFPRKPDLFLAALESDLSRIKLSRDLEMSVAGDEDPATVLPKIVTFVLHVLVAQPELQHLLHVAAFELPGSSTVISDYLGPIFDRLCAYFKRGAEKHTMRNVDPTLATLGLVGIVAAHQSLRDLFTRERLTHPELEPAIAAYVNLYLHGLQPPPDGASDSSGSISFS